MKIKYLWIVLLLFIVFGCDDNTGSLGGEMMPDEDNISVKTNILDVTTQSILADSIYARTSTAYLGKYTDPDFGAFEADFLTQFNCTDNLKIQDVPDSLVMSNSITLNLYYDKNNFYGDSLAINKLNVYELNKNIQDGSKEYYYTAINPENYYDSQDILGSKLYSIRDLSVKDSTWNANDLVAISIPLPLTLFDRIKNLNKEHPEYFTNSETFIDKVFKGIYVKHENGEGSILYIERITLNLNTIKYKTDSLGHIYRDNTNKPNKDSILYGTLATFEATKEVIQANRFQNDERLKELVAQKQHTYLKTPAGIFTEATLPMNEIVAGEYAKDTINSVQLSFTAYNEVGSNNTPYKMPKPERILMVRKKDMYSFFEKNQLADNITSYTATLGSNNIYKFGNINNLINTCVNEKREEEKTDPDWESKNPDWNKVVLIPISVTTTTSNSATTIVDINHDLRLTSAKLLGGPEGEHLKLYVTYTTFGK